VLWGRAEGSVVFTRLRQSAHPTNALFLKPACVSSLKGISIGSAVFALPTHWFRPPRKEATFAGRVGPSPPPMDRSVVSPSLYHLLLLHVIHLSCTTFLVRETGRVNRVAVLSREVSAQNSHTVYTSSRTKNVVPLSITP